MAFSFPLSPPEFADLFSVEEAIFTPLRNDHTSGLGSGQPLNAELASPLWQGDVTTGWIPNDDAEALAALFEILCQPGKDFYIHNPRKLGPRQDKDGSILGAASPTLHTIAANNHQVRVTGLPSGYVLSRGDMFAFDYGPMQQRRRAFHRFAETVSATSGGLTPLAEVTPHIRPGAVAGAAVTLIRPAMRARLVPGSYRPIQAGSLHMRFSFSVTQKLY